MPKYNGEDKAKSIWNNAELKFLLDLSCLSEIEQIKALEKSIDLLEKITDKFKEIKEEKSMEALRY